MTNLRPNTEQGRNINRANALEAANTTIHTTSQDRIRALEAELSEANSQLAKARDGWFKAVELSIDIRNQLEQATESCDKLSEISGKIAAERDEAIAQLSSVSIELGQTQELLLEAQIARDEAQLQLEHTRAEQVRADLDRDIAASQAAGVNDDSEYSGANVDAAKLWNEAKPIEY